MSISDTISHVRRPTLLSAWPWRGKDEQRHSCGTANGGRRNGSLLGAASGQALEANQLRRG